MAIKSVQRSHPEVSIPDKTVISALTPRCTTNLKEMQKTSWGPKHGPIWNQCPRVRVSNNCDMTEDDDNLISKGPWVALSSGSLGLGCQPEVR